MLMQMLGSFAEFERAMVRERTRAGLKAAAARGRKGGRQPKLTPEQKAEILDGLGSGRKSAADLARLFTAGRPTGKSKTRNTLLISPTSAASFLRWATRSLIRGCQQLWSAMSPRTVASGPLWIGFSIRAIQRTSSLW